MPPPVYPIVLTGSTGFIGTAVRTELLRRGLEVSVFHRSQLEKFDAPAGSVCIHVAGNNNSRMTEAEFEEERCIALELLDRLLAIRPGKIVLVSSAVVYGEYPQSILDETLSPLAMTPYARIKIELEGRLVSGRDCVARLANVFGPGMPDGNVLSDVLSQARSKDPIRLKGLKHVRDFVFVEDVARALVDLALRNCSGIFNVASGMGTSVYEIAQVLSDACGAREIKGDDRTSSHLVLDIQKISSELGWQPRVPLLQWLKEEIQERLK
jgi:nucleoside-diphosphate-sugar epimerase